MTDVAISKAHEPESRITETAPIPGGLAIATIVSDIRISLKEPYPTLQGTVYFAPVFRSKSEPTRAACSHA